MTNRLKTLSAILAAAIALMTADASDTDLSDRDAASHTDGAGLAGASDDCDQYLADAEERAQPASTRDDSVARARSSSEFRALRTELPDGTRLGAPSQQSDGIVTFVTFPIEGEALDGSHLTVVMQESEVVHGTVAVAQSDAAGRVTARFYQGAELQAEVTYADETTARIEDGWALRDGERVSVRGANGLADVHARLDAGRGATPPTLEPSAQADAADVTLASAPATPAHHGGSGGFWNCVNVTLQWLGVPAWVINGIALVCTAACLFTKGTACVVCVGGVLGAYSGLSAYTVAHCATADW